MMPPLADSATATLAGTQVWCFWIIGRNGSRIRLPAECFLEVSETLPMKRDAQLGTPSLNFRVVICQFSGVKLDTRECHLGVTVRQRGKAGQVIGECPGSLQPLSPFLTFERLRKCALMPARLDDNLEGLGFFAGILESVSGLLNSPQVQQTGA